MSMTVIPSDEFPVSQCTACRHLRMDGTASCAAFPAGIPDAIRTNQHDHRQGYSGDNGIRFEAKPGRTHPLDEGKDARPTAKE